MSPVRPWSDADIAQLLISKLKSSLADDLDAQYPFWNSVVSDTSDVKVLNLFHINYFEISAVLYSIQYCTEGNDDVPISWCIRISGY
jgi:hypothetical protein